MKDKKKKRDYWDISSLWNTGAQYLMAYGQNCNGKSFQAKKKAIEKALQGVVYNADSIRKCLSEMEISHYFDGVVADDLIGMMF